jgi:hypothetical protein
MTALLREGEIIDLLVVFVGLYFAVVRLIKKWEDEQ